MDTFTVIASVVLLAFIAWILVRNLGRGRRQARRDGSDAGTGTTYAAASGGSDRRHHDNDGPGGDGDAGGGGDGGGGGGGD